ncbi:Cystathionine gamma-lyase [Neolecta irregularis DAH-3]|uniref:cystathionine gamma-lyase n=1 Tax=Neolecta irregularis (strain DAH-3) TaxID=1198029 RepID=A0A1U7LLB7_NEOID|nr:Cystathionine gamma-lyase [Neolecta irregularis DAH-3]|eukprot:OLL23456.1 Cystathionine gamma-lyase [Neolecta irregularis DAH-3]
MTRSDSISIIQNSPPQNTTHLEFASLAIHAGSPHDPVTGAVIEPISLSTTFSQRNHSQYEYSRSANPNRDNFEAATTALEAGARYSVAFASGSASTSMIVQALLAPGSRILASNDVYGGTFRYFSNVAKAHGVTVSFENLRDPELIRDNWNDNTKMVWIESPSNPTLSLVDIAAISEIAHQRGAIVVADNTFLSPYLSNPILLGADIVSHSVTKYINGHSDVIMGVASFAHTRHFEKVKFLQNAIGAVPSPFDCFLAHRGLKTLHLRMKACCDNALAVAEALESHPAVTKVLYPGLASHPQRNLAQKQHRKGLGGGMVSFRIHGGYDAAQKFCRSTKLFTLAESLGGIESLCEIPWSMTHAAIDETMRIEFGVTENLVRLSVGCEDAEDLVKDVIQAVEKATMGGM